MNPNIHKGLYDAISIVGRFEADGHRHCGTKESLNQSVLQNIVIPALNLVSLTAVAAGTTILG